MIAQNSEDKNLDLRFINPESSEAFHASVPSDMTVLEAIERLMLVAHSDGSPWLVPQPEGAVGYVLVVERTGNTIASGQVISDAGVVPGDVIVVRRESHGAGPSVVEAAAGLAAAKLIIDGAGVVVNGYRAKTERKVAELEREKFEAERSQAIGNDDED